MTDPIPAPRHFSDQPLRLGDHLYGVAQCPHCAVPNPVLVAVWKSERALPRGDGKPPSMWGVYGCTTCGSIVSAKADPAYGDSKLAGVMEIFPKPKQAHEDIPDIARNFLQQAYQTLHAPDAAGLMAGSAVDAMLKESGYENGGLYARIDQALADHLLTQNMADWAHSVRLGANRPRHADSDNPHLTAAEAEQSVAFAEALADFLFVLTAKVNRGIAATTGGPRPSPDGISLRPRRGRAAVDALPTDC